MFLFYNELTEGMAAPGMIRSKIPAGLVKAASSWDEITSIEDWALRGAAVAAKRAGVAVYTDCINQAQRQMEILIEEGLEPERMVIGNCDDGRAIDLRRDKKIARKGGYVAYDHIGWEDAAFTQSITDDRRVELVKKMVTAGYTEHIILSCSAIGYPLGVKSPGHSFTHLLRNFVPNLKKAGVSENDINTMLMENPKRILSSS
jgi:phosphotriesterase-related protein